MSDILVISGHPNYKASFANKHILEEFHKLVPAAEIVQLAELYPDFNVDTAKEQERLTDVKTLVFEFPFWWFSSPSLMHRYVEQVFTHGFAYGSKGKKLQGKRFIISFTTGAPESAYSPEGYEGFEMSAFMPQFLAMTRLTGLDYKGSVISYAMSALMADEKEREEIMRKAKDHSEKLARLVLG